MIRCDLDRVPPADLGITNNTRNRKTLPFIFVRCLARTARDPALLFLFLFLIFLPSPFHFFYSFPLQSSTIAHTM